MIHVLSIYNRLLSINYIHIHYAQFLRCLYVILEILMELPKGAKKDIKDLRSWEWNKKKTSALYSFICLLQMCACNKHIASLFLIIDELVNVLNLRIRPLVEDKTLFIAFQDYDQYMVVTRQGIRQLSFSSDAATLFCNIFYFTAMYRPYFYFK